MSEEDIRRYGAALYSRIDEAVMLQRARIEGGDWQPEPNKCHHNVTEWCQHNQGYTPVRGWLYFDLAGLTNYVKFVAHSAVRTPEGELSDITPSNASKDYPFIPAVESEHKYAELVEACPNGEVNHFK